MEELRSNKEFAKEVFEDLLPDELSQHRSEVYPNIDLMGLSVWEGRKKFAVREVKNEHCHS